VIAALAVYALFVGLLIGALALLVARSDLLARRPRRQASAESPAGRGTDPDIPPDLSTRHEAYLYLAPHADGSHRDGHRGAAGG
jgi:hypothetical protein